MKKLVFLFLFLTTFTAYSQQFASNTTFTNYLIKSDGSLWAWGQNLSGKRFWDGTTDNKYVPVKLGSENNWKEISPYGNNTWAIKKDGSLWAWGENFEGFLGDGTTGWKDLPIRIGTDNDWKSISAASTIVALKNDGTLWAWGSNNWGQYGLGYGGYGTPGGIGAQTSYVPKQIGTAADNWKKVIAGGSTIAGIKNDGSLWIWGRHFYPDNSGAYSGQYVPSRKENAYDWKDVAISGEYLLAIKNDGSLWAMGQNAFGQLGDGTTIDRHSAPVRIGTDLNWKSVAVSPGRHSLAIKNDGSLWAWGDNTFGELGDGTTTNRLVPTRIGTSLGWQSATLGTYNAHAINNCGIWSWGSTVNGVFLTPQNIGFNVAATPTITASGPTTFIKGGSVTLTASSGSSYVWSNGATTQSITVTNSGSYSVEVNSGTACAGTSIATTVNVIGDGLISQNDTTICPGSSITLSIDTVANPIVNFRTGLVAYYPFNNNTLDESGNANHGTNIGAALTSDRFGRSNSAYYFSSTNCATSVQANINTSSITSGLTIALWALKSGEGCLQPRLLEFASDPNGVGAAQWIWAPQGQRLGSVTSDGTLAYGTFDAKPNNTWTHLVYTNDGVSAKFYQDGVLIGSMNSSGNPILQGNVAFGRMNHTDWDAFNGNLDDIGIWNRALSPSEINQMYTATSSPISILWSTGATTPAISVSPSQTTTYFVTITDGVTTYRDSVTVTVNPALATITPTGAATICQGGNVTLTANTGQSYLWSNGATTRSITVSTPGSYTVSVTNTNGCTATSLPTLVGTSALPTATITANGATTLCEGGSVLLTASTGSAYLWSNGETTQSIRVSSAGSYTVQVFNAIGCSATSEATIVVVNPLPTASITASGATTFCQGGSVTLTASAGSTYLWSTGAITRSITVNASGNYTVQITNASGCLSIAASMLVTVNLPTSAVRYPTVTALKNVTKPLSARLIGAYTYLWIPNTGLDNEFIARPNFNYDRSQEYIVQQTSAGGCITRDTVLVKVLDKSQIFVPKAFSPNGDGNNELLKPILVGLDKLIYFRVYNRWGILVYETSVIGEGWNGFYKGEKQLYGAYSWIAQGEDSATGKVVNATGSSVLIR